MSIPVQRVFQSGGTQRGIAVYFERFRPFMNIPYCGRSDGFRPSRIGQNTACPYESKFRRNPNV